MKSEPIPTKTKVVPDITALLLRLQSGPLYTRDELGSNVYLQAKKRGCVIKVTQIQVLDGDTLHPFSKVTLA